jgi:anti-anti-sigma factor
VPVVTADLVEVRLLRLPIAVHKRTDLHMRGLQRELDLIRFRDRDTTSVPHRLQALVDDITAEFGGVGVAPRNELQNAIERDDATIDLTYETPASIGPAANHLVAMLDEVDDYCRSRGHLLTLVTPPEALEYRRWFLGEFIRQTAGNAPVPWPERRMSRAAARADASPPPAPSHAAVPADWTVHSSDGRWELRVSGPLDLVSAPTLRDVLAELTSGNGDGLINLTECGFVDSVGVSVLLAALTRAHEHDGDLLFRLSPAVERVFDVAGVLTRIKRTDHDP